MNFEGQLSMSEIMALLSTARAKIANRRSQDGVGRYEALHLWEAEAAIGQARTQLQYAELARGEQR